MAEDQAAWEHRLFTHLTAIKLANQILDRQPGLTAYQRRLIQTALQAANELTADLLEHWQAERTQGTTE
jgi:hypothetical protein